jgi:hypothetical protein
MKLNSGTESSELDRSWARAREPAPSEQTESAPQVSPARELALWEQTEWVLPVSRERELWARTGSESMIPRAHSVQPVSLEELAVPGILQAPPQEKWAEEKVSLRAEPERARSVLTHVDRPLSHRQNLFRKVPGYLRAPEDASGFDGAPSSPD